MTHSEGCKNKRYPHPSDDDCCCAVSCDDRCCVVLCRSSTGSDHSWIDVPYYTLPLPRRTIRVGRQGARLGLASLFGQIVSIWKIELGFSRRSRNTILRAKGRLRAMKIVVGVVVCISAAGAIATASATSTEKAPAVDSVELIDSAQPEQGNEKAGAASQHGNLESFDGRHPQPIAEGSSATFSLDPDDPQSLGYYDGVRLLASRAMQGDTSVREGLLGYHTPAAPTAIPRDVSIRVEDNDNSTTDDNGDHDTTKASLIRLVTTHTPLKDASPSEATIHLGHITTMVPLPALVPAYMDWAVSSLLAVHHFNNGIGTILPFLANVTGGGNDSPCRVRFTHEYLDTEFNVQQASRVFIQDVLPRHVRDISKPRPTTIIGAVRSAVTTNLATLTGVSRIPQLSHISKSRTLDNTDEYPLFGRLIPNVEGGARAVVAYLRSLQVSHVSLVYHNDEYGESYRNAFEIAAADPGTEPSIMKIHTVPVDRLCSNRECLEPVVDQLANTEYRYFVGSSVTRHNFDTFMQLAHNRSIAGPGYVWLLNEGFSDTVVKGMRYPEGSILAQVTHGIGVVQPSVSVSGRPESENFIREWETLNEPEFKEYFQKQQPRLTRLPPFFAVEKDDFHFEPSAFAGVLYDTVIAIGLASCRLTQEKDQEPFSAEELFDAIKMTEFEGVSGRIELDPSTGTRNHDSMIYTVSNIVSQGTDSTGNVTFALKETIGYLRDVTDGEDEQSEAKRRWIPLQGSDPFRYSDNTFSPPPDLPPPTVNVHVIESPFLVFGWVLCGILISFSVLCAAWVARFQQLPIIRASQPVFLYTICAGTFLMGCSILPLSAQPPIPSKILNVACMSVWWWYSIGFVLVFSALFAKTLRLNMILPREGYQRMKVTPRDVLMPLLAVLGLNIAILIVWSIVSPLEYHFVEGTNTDEYGRSLDSYAHCHYDSPSLAFAGGLLALNFFVALIALFEAYKGRDIVSDIAESKYIFYALASNIEAFALGLPVVLLSWDSPTASFAVISSLVFVTGMATLFLLFVPKASVAWKTRGRRVGRRANSMVLGQLHRSNARLSVDWSKNMSDHSFDGRSEQARHSISASSRTGKTERRRSSDKQGIIGANVNPTELSKILASAVLESSSDSVDSAPEAAPGFTPMPGREQHSHSGHTGSMIHQQNGHDADNHEDSFDDEPVMVVLNPNS